MVFSIDFVGIEYQYQEQDGPVEDIVWDNYYSDLTTYFVIISMVDPDFDFYLWRAEVTEVTTGNNVSGVNYQSYTIPSMNFQVSLQYLLGIVYRVT